MKTCAITITYNRLDLTKRTVESFYKKTGVDYHLFIDNGSTDGTVEWLKESRFDYIPLDRNYGIASAFIGAFRALEEKYDYILKLDNDVETVSEDLVGRIVWFYGRATAKFVASPVDLLIDPRFQPRELRKWDVSGMKVSVTTHTGGAFQLIPHVICKKLCDDFRHFKMGDQAIGGFYQRNGWSPCYLLDLEMKHIGLNQSTAGAEYIM